jgi:hypothetical protein
VNNIKDNVLTTIATMDLTKLADATTYIWACEATCNESAIEVETPAANFTMEVDDTNPGPCSVSFLTTGDPTPEVNFSTNDSRATCKYHYSDVAYGSMTYTAFVGAGSWKSNITVLSLPELGNNTVYCRCKDDHGNTQTSSGQSSTDKPFASVPAIMGASQQQATGKKRSFSVTTAGGKTSSDSMIWVIGIIVVGCIVMFVALNRKGKTKYKRKRRKRR